jgi:hypothetical protein
MLSIENQSLQNKLLDQEKNVNNFLSLNEKNENLTTESKILTQKLEETLQMNSILNGKLNSYHRNVEEFKVLEDKISLLVKYIFFYSLFNFLFFLICNYFFFCFIF